MPPKTIGIDQFIGEADYINQGTGTAAIKLFLEVIVAKHQPKQIILDPHPTVLDKAIAAIEKVAWTDAG